MQTSIQKWGNSQGIRIPKAFLEAIGMKVNDPVEIERQDNCIIIKKLENRKTELTLDDIFSGYDSDYKPEEYDWGKPIGKEAW